MSSFHAGGSLGELAGAGVAGLLADAGTSLFVALAVSGLASAVCGLAALLLPHAPPCSSEQTGFAWPSRAMLGLCAMGSLSFAVEGGAADWAGVYLQTELGASAALSSMGLTVFAAAMVACRLCGNVVVRQLGPVQVIRWGSVLTGLGPLGAVVLPNVTAAAISFAFVGPGAANTIPVLFSAAGRNGSAGVAMVATAGYGAVMGAPPLISVVSDAVGLRAALLMLMAGAGLITLLARRGRALA